MTRLPHLARLAALALAAGGAACDVTFLEGPRRDIDRDRDDDDPPAEGEGEGEGEGGEGEGEGPPEDVAVCGGAFTVSPKEAIALGTTRARHAAALLADGRVLVAGGHDEATYTSVRSAEVFDPATNAFTATGEMRRARYDFALVALDDGRALAVGGFNNDFDAPDDNGDLAALELWDPATGTWSEGPVMPEARTGVSAVKVAGGRVLIFGGQTGAESIPTSVLVFDPVDDSLTDSGSDLSFARTAHAAHALSDGRVLVVGGYYTGARDEVDLIAQSGIASAVAGVPGARRSSCAANDADGSLLVFGGLGAGTFSDVQAFSPAEAAWRPAGDMIEPRFACAAAELSCGTLICGGVDTTTCEFRDHGATASQLVVDDIGSEFSGTLTVLDGARALLVGGFVGDGVSGEARIIELVAR